MVQRHRRSNRPSSCSTKPGQSAAAARILPNQSTSSEFESLTITDWASAHTFADGLRSLIGTIVSLTYRGTSYGNVLVQDVTVLHIDKVMYAQGVHPTAQRTHTPTADASQHAGES